MKVSLACSTCHARNYTTVKTTADQDRRLRIKKYCSRCGCHTMHAETK
ncbi:50S ribosomal protein L33 [Alkalicoccus chagannorensis]|nr:50S ribosomal protein L33 [Alkalicoccus chagannorensis]